ncbi:MAG TPA: FkbM family methyltransferase [Desulfuromonadaceae bacterium]
MAQPVDTGLYGKAAGFGATQMTTGGGDRQHLTGRLGGDRAVALHPEAVRYAGSWNPTTSGTASLAAEEASLVRIFHDLCSEYGQPFVIDVGAHVGTFSLVGAFHKGMRGLCFEPHPAVCDILRANLALNNMTGRFVVHQQAISNYPGRRILKSPHKDRDSGLSCIGQPNFGAYKEQYVDVVRLDDVVSSSAIDAVDIITVDAEGCELFVAIGAAETITRFKPDLLLRVNSAHLIQFGLYINNLTDYLELLGYHGHWVGAEAMLFRHPYRKARAGDRFVTGHPEMDGLKVAIVKQACDVFGPWRSERYDVADPLKVLQKWPSKYSYLEMAHLFQADWYVVPFCHDSKNVRQKIDYHQQAFDDHVENVRHIDEVPIDDYDVVISLDPILRPPGNGKVLHAYFQNEHHHTEYARSLKGPLPGYDLFLDHMLRAPAWVYDLPQPVAFPYPRSPYHVRNACKGQKNAAVWFDKRFVMMLTHGNEAADRGGFDATVMFLEQRLGMPIVCRYLNFEDMTRWGDPYEYMQEMSACTYYVNLIACGAGQGLCDAASLGLICFGTPNLPYHQAVCHPVCLCRDLSELEWKLSLVRGSTGLQQEIIVWQDAALSDRLVGQPLRLLQAAVEKKRKRHQAAKTVHPPTVSLLAIELAVGELSPSVGRINSEKLKLRAQAEYEQGNYDAAIHSCNQALWFGDADSELYYIMALACYAAKDTKHAQQSLAESLKLHDAYQPALTLNNVLKYDSPNPEEETRYNFCAARVAYLIYNNFMGYDKHADDQHIPLYNSILDDMMRKYIELEDQETYVSTQHYKQRLNQIADF